MDELALTIARTKAVPAGVDLTDDLIRDVGLVIARSANEVAPAVRLSYANAVLDAFVDVDAAFERLAIRELTDGTIDVVLNNEGGKP